MTQNETLVKELTELNLTIGSIESYTGGLFGKEITDVPGASKVYKGGIIVYTIEEKVRLLGIDPDFIEKNGVVSKAVARELAYKGKEKLNTDIVVSFTGNAGPTKDVCSHGSEVGEVYIGILFKDSFYCLESLHQELSRNEIREGSIKTVVEFILNILKKSS
jgi:PncC family amidohydrolase